MTRSGVHCSVRGGFVGAVREASSLGCETLQMFTQSPRGWKTRVYTENEFREFRNERAAAGLFPIAVHAPYLPNLCTSDDSLYLKSLNALKDDLTRCEKLGADYLVIHPGAYSPGSDYSTGLRRIQEALNDALASVPGTSRILIENMAGGGRRVGGPFREIADMLSGVNDMERMGVCFDTCHAFAAGYDLSTKEGAHDAVAEFRKEIGLKHLFVFHVNDSKDGVGSHRDRHENIGEGRVGQNGFRYLFEADDFRRCAFILETPKEPAPHSDRQNLSRLRTCLKGIYGN